MQSQFRVQVRSEGPAAVLVLIGELDLASGPELEQALQTILSSPAQQLVIDLRQLDFMDSTGLSIIVRTHQRFADEGRQLGLVRGPAQVQRLLDLTGVAARLPLADAPEDLLNGRDQGRP